MKTVSLCASVHDSVAVVKIKSTTSLFYQVRNVQNYAVECTCQTKLKVCVSVFDLVSWRRGQTTVAVSAYTRTLVGTTHCPSERTTVSGKIGFAATSWKNIKMYMHMILCTFFREIPFLFRLLTLTGYSASWARPASVKASSIAAEKNSNGFVTMKPEMWYSARVTTVLKSGGLSFTIGILSSRALGVTAWASESNVGLSMDIE